MKTKPIPQYDGSSCTSACYNDYDCPHEENFDEEMGIRRLHKDFGMTTELETHYEVVWTDGKPMTKIEGTIKLK